MITKDALEYIAQMAACGLVSDEQGVTLPASTKIESLEVMSPNRYRFRGTFSTQSIPDFVRYARETAERAEVVAPCFIDANAMAATAIFNLGSLDSPGHCDHRAILKLPMTAAMQSLVKMNESSLSQTNCIDWLQDWLPNIHFADHDGTERSPASALNALRNIQIESKRSEEYGKESLSEKRSSMESIEAKSTLKLPDFAHFTCVPYEGIGERSFPLRISVILGGADPVIKMRIVGKEALEEAMAGEFRNELKFQFSETQIQVFIGSFDCGK